MLRSVALLSSNAQCSQLVTHTALGVVLQKMWVWSGRVLVRDLLSYLYGTGLYSHLACTPVVVTYSELQLCGAQVCIHSYPLCGAQYQSSMTLKWYWNKYVYS